MKGQQIVALAFVVLLGVSTFMMFEVRDEVRLMRDELKKMMQVVD